MKRILIIHPSLGLGGAEKIITFLTNGVSEKYDTHLLLLKDTAHSLEVSDGVKVHCENAYSDKPILGKDLFTGVAAFKCLVNTIKTKLEVIKPDLLICFDLRVLVASYFARKKTRTKILFSERADPYEHSKLWGAVLKYIYKRIEHVVFQTEAARDYYGKLVFEKNTVIANPAFQRTNALLDNYVYNRDYIFSAGRFQHRKGFDVSIRAFQLIADQFQNLDYLIFGSGAEKDNLQSLITELHLENRVFLKEPINHIVDINKKAKLFILPSRSEGIPNILIEAMMEGIPCVATDCSPGGARLLSDNGRYCRLAKNDDYQSLSVEMEQALLYQDKTSTMCAEAQESLKRFDAKVILGQWFGVINNLIG